MLRLFLNLGLLCAWAVMALSAKGAEPIVILIGLDGFRYDYLEKFRPPSLLQLAAVGCGRSGWRRVFRR